MNITECSIVPRQLTYFDAVENWISFAHVPLKIWLIIRIWKVLDRFLGKTILIFPKNFLNFNSDTIENSNIKNLSNKAVTVISLVILSNSEVASLQERKMQKQQSMKQQLSGHLLPIWHTKKCNWRSKDELISDVLLCTPTHGHTNIGRLAKTYNH